MPVHVYATMIGVPAVLDVDLAGVGVGDDGEGLLREVDGAPAPPGAEVGDLDGTPWFVAPVHLTTYWSPQAAPPPQKTSLAAAIIVPSAALPKHADAALYYILLN
jgi:hypothetical protein